MSDDPFREPQDDQPTIFFRPTPGGRGTAKPRIDPAGAEPPPGTAPPSRPAAAARSPLPPLSDTPVDLPDIGQSPLLTAAAPLLQLLARLPHAETPPDPLALRQPTVRALQHFQAVARAEGIADVVVRTAHYALCAAIDDVVMNARWGRSSPWVKDSLVATFHKDVKSGEEFYQRLNLLKRQPANNLALLELMYFCLALGYQGQFRLLPRGLSELEAVRQDLYSTIVGVRSRYDPSLSLHWEGIAAPYRRARAVVPIWVMVAVAVAVIAVAYFGFALGLGGSADGAIAMAAGLPPQHLPALDRVVPAPPPAPPPPPAQPPKISLDLHQFLAPEIAAHLVTVTETPQTIQVRIFNGGMFASGSATVRPDFVPLLERIGEALNDESGRVLVTGHTDNRPIRTVQFPSNIQLSVARARAAADVMMHRLHDPARLTIAGRGDTQPIASNDTEPGRQQNRRIDIVLQRQGL